ncbi:MAG: DUF3172 domain-containing protein [Leptolyngbyaceae cyanobacterium RU_5_1]|nr:DUF3172 domain-containing protein [Leptolyngbyaceae cyanobacterium RU_5_1]
MAKRRPRSSPYNDSYEREFDDYLPPQDNSPKRGKSSKAIAFNALTLFILAGVFILGLGVGIAFTSVSTSAESGRINNVIDLDKQSPNPELCVQYGASAIVTDMRVFVTLNPLNFFVSQPVSQPGCVLRTNNWSVLEQRGLVKSEQVRDCKQRMNTFGFTGQLENSPEIDCIYQNDSGKNLFLTQQGPNGRVGTPENEKF